MTFFLANKIGNKMAKFSNSADLMTSPQIHAGKDRQQKQIYLHFFRTEFCNNKRPSQNTCLQQ